MRRAIEGACKNRSAAPAAAPCFVHWTRSPPLPSGLPTHPQRPGDDPLDPKGEGRSGRLAEKALYCALEENAHRFFRAVLIRRVLRTKQPNENWRSALIFASIILDAPQKSAKRKRMQPPDAPILYARPPGAPPVGAPNGKRLLLLYTVAKEAVFLFALPPLSRHPRACSWLSRVRESCHAALRHD